MASRYSASAASPSLSSARDARVRCRAPSRCRRPSVCSPRRVERASRASSASPGPRGGLDQLAQRPRRRRTAPGVSSLASRGRRERLLVAAETVHEHGARPAARTARRFPGRRRWPSVIDAVDQLRRPRPRGRGAREHDARRTGAMRVPVASLTASTSAISSAARREVAAERGRLAAARCRATARTSSAPESRASCDRAPADLEAAVVVPQASSPPASPASPSAAPPPRRPRARERGDRAPQHGRRGGAPVGEDQRQAVQQQVARSAAVPAGRARPPRRGRRRAGCRPRSPAGRRTAPRPTRRGTCRARAARRASRASSPPGAAAAGRRRRGSGRTRPRPAADPRGPARARRAARPRRPPAARGPTSNAPAPRLAWAAASARSARRAGSPVSATARCRNAAAAARPPRACARPAERSSSRATSSSGPAAAAARCHARRSGSTSRSVASRQRQVGRPALRRAAPTGTRPSAPSGWRNVTRSPSASSPSVASTAESAIPRRSQARCRSSGSPTGSAAATSSSRRASLGQRLEPPDVALLDPVRQIAGLRHPEPAGQLRRRQAPGQLEQRERVAPRLGDDPVAHRARPARSARAELSSARASPSTRPRTSSSGRCRSSSPGSRAANTSPTGSASSRRATNASVSAEVLVQPLRVVDDAQQRPLLGRLGEQAEHGEADQEPVRRGPRGSARRRSGARRAAEPGAARADRAAARTAGAGSRRPAPSRTRRRPPARRSGPTPTRPGARAAPSSRSRPRRAGPATGSRPGGRRRSGRPAGRTRRPARAGSCAPFTAISRVGQSVPQARECDQVSTRAVTPGATASGEQARRRPNHASRPRKEILMSSSPAPAPARPRLRRRRAEPPRGVHRHVHEPVRRHRRVRLHAVIGGDGPPLLLVHGWPETWYAWRLLMPALARDFEVIAVDQRGSGLSDKPAGGYDTGTLAGDLVALMDALGHERFAVVGHDTGFAISYALAADHPDRVERVALAEIPGLPGRGSLTARVRPRADQRPALAPAVQPAREDQRAARHRTRGHLLRLGVLLPVVY